jgi:serine/threonine-protein kinase
MDLDKLLLTAPAVPVVDGVRNLSTTSGDAKFDVSPSGTLTYIAGKANLEGRTLSWLDNAGKTTPLLAKPEIYFSPIFSPDGTHLALAITASGNVWSYDWQRDILQKISSTPGRNFIPVWTADGKGIVYRSQSPDGFRLYWTRSDGASAAVLLAESKAEQQPYSFSPDGKRLAYSDLGGEGGSDLWTLPIDWSDPSTPKPGKPEVFLQTRALERDPAFSPDGRWLAYSATEGSNPEIYVRPFPASATGGKWQISSGGGVFPVWSRNGRELFYQKADGNGIMVATYTAKGATFSAEKPRTWSSHRIRQAQITRMFDLTPDGRRVVIVDDPDETDQKPDTHVNLLLNFTQELLRRVPAGK